MLMHLRMSVPDRPGMLAQITAALADVGADIRTIAVLERESGRAIDDIYLSWPEGRPAVGLGRAAGIRPRHQPARVAAVTSGARRFP